MAGVSPVLGMEDAGIPGARGKNRENIQAEESAMTLGTVLLIVVILLLIGAIPTWGHSRDWGYGPSGGLGLVLLIVIILLVMGKI
jgi:hypothetical protein